MEASEKKAFRKRLGQILRSNNLGSARTYVCLGCRNVFNSCEEYMDLVCPICHDIHVVPTSQYKYL